MAESGRTLLSGGRVYDSSSSALAVGDVFIDGGRIVEPFDAATADEIIDAAGTLVTPGWIDLHTHVFVGQDLAVDPNVVGPSTGVTTMIDAGSAGAHLYDAFVRGVLRDAVPRIRALLNISTIGTTSILLAGELRQLDYLDERACVETVRTHPDIIGIKVRASANVAGANATEALRRARRVADEVGLPLMVHVGPSPVTYVQALDTLGAGDVLTHCFSGYVDTPIADPDQHDRLLPAALDARQRGVLFDVGHGGGSFDARRVAAAVRAGFLPDTISSDVHAYANRAGGGDAPGSAERHASARSLTEEGLPLVVDKMLALGMSLEDTLQRVTAAPAAAAGLASFGFGTLQPGAPADVAVFRIVPGCLPLQDSLGHEFTGECSVRPAMTLQAGVVVFDTQVPRVPPARTVEKGEA